jgi:hypothetical protein
MDSSSPYISLDAARDGGGLFSLTFKSDGLTPLDLSAGQPALSFYLRSTSATNAVKPSAIVGWVKIAFRTPPSSKSVSHREDTGANRHVS